MNIITQNTLIKIGIPAEVADKIRSNLDSVGLSRLAQVSKGEACFVEQKGVSPEIRRNIGLVPMCDALPPRRALSHYQKYGFDQFVLKGYKNLVVRDIPFQSILSTILATVTINVTFLYINRMLTSVVVGSIVSSLPMACSLLVGYVLVVAALQYCDFKRGDWNIGKDELVHWALGIIPITAFYFLNEMPKVFNQLYKSSVWTTGYFLALHALTAGVLIMLNRCQDPSRLFNALGLFIVSVCLFRNMANSF